MNMNGFSAPPSASAPAPGAQAPMTAASCGGLAAAMPAAGAPAGAAPGGVTTAAAFMELLERFAALDPTATQNASKGTPTIPAALEAAVIPAGEEDGGSDGGANDEPWLALPELLQALVAAERPAAGNSPGAPLAAEISFRDGAAPTPDDAVHAARLSPGERKPGGENASLGLQLTPFDAQSVLPAPVTDGAPPLPTAPQAALESAAKSSPDGAAPAMPFTRAESGLAISHASPSPAASQAPETLRSEPLLRSLRESVGSPGWSRELGTELLLLTERGQQSASLKLAPEHLGPLEVRIAVREGEASLQFAASHADTRAALEQALPRLRELFAAQGLTIADAGIFHQESRHPTPEAGSTRAGAGNVPTEEPGIDAASASVRRIGLVDTYA